MNQIKTLVERSQLSLQDLVFELVRVEDDLGSVPKHVLLLRVPIVYVEILEEKFDLSQCGHR